RFVPKRELHPDSIANLVQWASKVALFVNEALSSFGFSPASLKFLQNLDMKDDAPPPSTPTNDDWARQHTAGFGVLELVELLTRTDDVRARSVEPDEARSHIVEFLKALDLDPAAMSVEGRPNELHFHYRGVNMELSFLNDD